MKQSSIPVGVLSTTSCAQEAKVTFNRVTEMDRTSAIINSKPFGEPLLQNQEFIINVLRNSPNPILVTEPDSTVRCANRAFRKLTGFASAEIIGSKPPYPWWPEENLPKLMRQLEDTMRHEPMTIEEELEKKSGERFWVEISSVPVWENGKLSYCLVNWVDITQRRQMMDAIMDSETKYRALVDNASEAIIVVQGDIIKFANPRALQLFDYGEEKLCSRPFFDVIHVDDRRRFSKSYWTILRRSRQGAVVMGRILNKHTDVKWVRCSMVLIPWEGKPAVFALLQDITEQKSTQEELDKSRKQLQSLLAHLQCVRENERTRLAREIHDELGQVLTALKMDVSWLRSQLTNTKQPILDKMVAISTLMDETINSVRRISTELRPGVLDDLGVEAAIEWQLQEFAKRSGIMCEVRCLPEHPPLSRDLSTVLFRIFQEAITNVARHAQATKVKVKLMTEPKDIVLQVIDNGKGITQGQISDPKSLGLVGMRERVNSFGGNMRITGYPNKGTTLTVSIPTKPR
jgi:PAS domain S-box-containing protein